MVPKIAVSITFSKLLFAEEGVAAHPSASVWVVGIFIQHATGVVSAFVAVPETSGVVSQFGE